METARSNQNATSTFFPIIKSYEIKIARTGQRVPVVNGVHLHSMYNPVKEAEITINKYEDLMRKCSNILILGLGFGHHVNAITRKLSEIYGDNYSVAVIDPNETLAHDVASFNIIESKNVHIFASPDIEQLYQKKELVQFMASGPGVISHMTSTNLYEQFFNAFLDYKAPNDLQSIIERLSPANKELGNYLSAYFTPEDTLNDCFKKIKQGNPQFEGMDFLMLAFEQMTRAKVMNPSEGR